MRSSLSLGFVLACVAFSLACGEEECRLDRDCAEGQICAAAGHCRTLPVVSLPHQDLSDGFDDAPGSGHVFVIDTLSFLPPGQGFDLDAECRAEGECVDNALGSFGALFNDQIRQGLLGGETLQLIEIAGIDPPFRGDDANVTVKFYSAADADQPFFPANNFQIPQGETKCCEFLIRPNSLDQNGLQARHRLRARIEHGRLRTLEPGTIGLPLFPTFTSTGSPQDVELRRAAVTLSFSNNFSRLTNGMLGGVMPVASLFGIEASVCESENQLCPTYPSSLSWFEVLLNFARPDVDLDGDGLESFELYQGKIARCWDGCAGDCTRGVRINPVVPADPGSCVLSSAIADGFSTAVSFSAIPASIVGIGAGAPPVENK